MVNWEPWVLGIRAVTSHTGNAASSIMAPVSTGYSTYCRVSFGSSVRFCTYGMRCLSSPSEP